MERGDVFHTRCSQATPGCKKEEPTLAPCGPDHMVARHMKPSEVRRAATAALLDLSWPGASGLGRSLVLRVARTGYFAASISAMSLSTVVVSRMPVAALSFSIRVGVSHAGRVGPR